MAKKPMKFKRYEEGGGVEESKAKQRGLDISNKEEPVGFLQRLRMGNIDDPSSEAYKRFGAGRGRSEAPAKQEEPAPTRAIQPTPVAAPAPSARPLSDDMYSDFGPSEGRSSGETVKPTRPAASKPTVPAKPAAPKPAASKPAAPKPTAKNPEAEQEADNPKKTAPIDVTKLSLAERRKLNSTKSSPTDKRSVNERIREKFGFNKGGSVSSASKRADGIATKGKTKGTMIKMNYGGKC